MEEAEYKITAERAANLTPADQNACFATIETGGAVGMASMKRDFTRSRAVVIARFREEVVGIGVIKPVRKTYAAGIAAKCGVSFSPETPELGYVAVHPDHQGRKLSHRIMDCLLSQHSGRLFATTDNEYMKKALLRAGFATKGKQWRGKRGLLTFWERG